MLTKSILFLALAATSFQTFAKDSACEQLLAQSQNRAQRIYVFGADPVHDKNAHVQFGFESEYMLDELEGILKFYAPKFPDAQGEQEWRAMSLAQKTAWVKSQYGTRPEYAEKAALYKIGLDHEMDFLPDQLVFDSTGNLEIVLPPVDTFAQWLRQNELINAKIGVGSMQAMLSSPKSFFFGGKLKLSPEESEKQNLGWFIFTADLDALVKLESGAARYAADSSKEVARSFVHPWLGPMTKLKSTKLKEILSLNTMGQGFDKETLAFLKSDASFKYIGGSAYRPDIGGPERIGIELRSAHKDFKLLVAQVKRDMTALASDRSMYARFSEIPPFDSEGDFAKFSPPVQSMLKQLFPARQQAGISYTPEEVLALEVYRNFAFPLRAWGAYLEATGAGKDQRRALLQAQGDYVVKLTGIQERLLSGKITAAAAAVQIQGALAQFAVDSGLAKLLRNVVASISYSELEIRSSAKLAVA